MLTLNDIDTATNSHDGAVYSDLFKDVHGFRPRDVQFESIEAFDREFALLVQQLNEQQAEEEVNRLRNINAFYNRVLETVELCSCTPARALSVIADAEGELEEFVHYGNERLEWLFDLGYGSIDKLFAEKFQ